MQWVFMQKLSVLSVLSAALVLVSAPSDAQVAAADYQRAQSLRQQFEAAAASPITRVTKARS